MVKSRSVCSILIAVLDSGISYFMCVSVLSCEPMEDGWLILIVLILRPVVSSVTQQWMLGG